MSQRGSGAGSRCRSKPYEDLGFAKVDASPLFNRKDFPRVTSTVPGKPCLKLSKIARQLAKAGAPVLATRAEPCGIRLPSGDEFPPGWKYHRRGPAGDDPGLKNLYLW